VLSKVHQETFGKSGCRRIVPGQHLAADPKGRAVMIGALEKQKLVYILNRDASARLTISSPLEAHKVRLRLRWLWCVCVSGVRLCVRTADGSQNVVKYLALSLVCTY